MVFLQRRRPRYGAVGRRENRCMRLAAPSAKTMARFIFCYRSTAGLFQLFVGARCDTLTLAEREDISRGIASGSSIREIARGSAASRVDGEPGGGPPRRASTYRASEADHQAWKLALRPKACLLAMHSKLRTIVASKLILNWSPEQISGWLKRRYPEQREHARVPRNHLPQLIHPGSRGAEKRADSAPAVQAAIRRSVHARAGGNHTVRSSMPSPSGRGLQKSKIAPFPVIGRAICSAAPATVTSQPWWNDIHALSCWSKCPAKTRRPSSPR